MGMRTSRYGTRIAAVVCAWAIVCAGAAQAHELWVNASAPKDGTLTAELGYGDSFPKAESIAQDRAHIFEPLKVVTPEGTFAMELEGKDNYTYKLAKDLKKGSVLIVANYKPTYWSKGPDGSWAQSNRKQRPDADYVEEAAMYTKTVISVDGGSDPEFIRKPVGLRLEVVPHVDPATVRPGEKLPVRILLDGVPLKGAEVRATFDGFSEDESAKAFRAETNADGMVDVIPLKSGYWLISTEHVIVFEDKSLCDEAVLESTLSFWITE